MDLQAIGTSKKCILNPMRLHSARGPALPNELIADLECMYVSDAGIANSKDKE